MFLEPPSLFYNDFELPKNKKFLTSFPPDFFSNFKKFLLDAYVKKTEKNCKLRMSQVAGNMTCMTQLWHGNRNGIEQEWAWVWARAWAWAHNESGNGNELLVHTLCVLCSHVDRNLCYIRRQMRADNVDTESVFQLFETVRKWRKIEKRKHICLGRKKIENSCRFCFSLFFFIFSLLLRTENDRKTHQLERKRISC